MPPSQFFNFRRELEAQTKERFRIVGLALDSEAALDTLREADVVVLLVDATEEKPIVIGKGGEMIKRIGTEARRDLQEMLEGPVYLDLHVKVRKDWREDERLVDELGLPKRQ